MSHVIYLLLTFLINISQVITNTGVDDIDGEWGEWLAWSSCSVSLECERGGVRTRTRLCDSPAPQAAGAECDVDGSSALEAEACLGDQSGLCDFQTPPAWSPEVWWMKTGGQGDPASMLMGEWFSYNMSIDLPTTNSDKNIVMEVFTNNPDNGLNNNAEPGRTALGIARCSVESYGSLLKTYSGDKGEYVDSKDVTPSENMYYHDTLGYLMERKHIEINMITNNGSDGSGNRISFDYDVLFGNIYSNVIKNTDYYVSSGIAVLDSSNEVEYAWVGQETIRSSADSQNTNSYDLIMTTNIDAINPLELKPSETYFFIATITSTNPVTNIEFEISEVFGHEDAIHFGIPRVEFGDGFRFSNNWAVNDRQQSKGRLHHMPEIASNSGLSVRKRRWRILGLLNVEATRDVAKTENQIVVTVPITLIAAKNDIGLDIYPTDKMHKFSASVISYPDTLFYPINAYSYNEVAIFEGDIKRVAGQPQLTASTTPAFVKGFPITMSNFWVGSSYTFISYVLLPVGGSMELNLRLACDDQSIAEPIGTAVSEPDCFGGSVGPIVPHWTVTETDSDGVGPSYGVMTNGGTQDAYVVLSSAVLGVGAGNTTCTLKAGAAEQSFSVSFNPLLDSDGSSLFSTVHIDPVYNSISDVFYGESTSVQLDFMVPPWSGNEGIEVNFKPSPIGYDGVNHYWRLCRVDVAEVTEDLTCLTRGQAQYTSAVTASYAKSDLEDYVKWFEDVGTLNISRTCPSQITEVGQHRFRARAFYEHIPGQETFFYWMAGAGNLDASIEATASFSNGSTWSSSFNFNILNSESSNSLKDQDSWLSCVNGEWYPLPSGKMVCHSGEFKGHDDAREICNKAGGYLVEITNKDDAQALLYLIWRLINDAGISKSTNKFRIGAIPKGYEWRWEHSGESVDICPGCILKPQNDDDDLTAYPDRHIFLKPTGSASNGYLSTLPYFDLYIESIVDNAEEFMCMKSGENSAATSPSMSRMLLETSTLNLGDVGKLKFHLKVPHGKSTPVVFTFTPNSLLRVCKVRLSHIGNNYPCVLDPSVGAVTNQNSSTIYFEDANKKPGTYAELSLKQVKNYGTGSYHPDGGLDPDTVQITVYVTSAIDPGESVAAVTGYTYKTMMAQGSLANAIGSSEISFTGITVNPASSFSSSYAGTIQVNVSLEGDNYNLVKGHCKRIRFSYPFPPGYKLPVYHIIENKDFSNGKYITFCGLYTVLGENFPCTSSKDVPWSPLPKYEIVQAYQSSYDSSSSIDWDSSIKYDAQNTSEFYRYASNYAEIIHDEVTANAVENMVHVEVAIRPDKDAPDNTVIGIQLILKLGTTTIIEPVTLVIKDLTDDNSPATNYTVQAKKKDKSHPTWPLPNIWTWTSSKLNGANLTGLVRDLVWVPFAIGIPSDGVYPFKILIRAPVSGGRAIYNLKTVRFPISNCTDLNETMCSGWNGQGDPTKPGDNVMGVNGWIDIERTYSMEKINSDRITTHMQVDQIYIDFGFITNAGYSKIWEADDGSDNVFLIWVGVEITDHPLTTNDTYHNIDMSVFVADEIVTASQPVGVIRNATHENRTMSVRPLLNYTLSQVEPSTTIYQRNNMAQFTSIVRHAESSLGEGSPVLYRIMMDQFTGYLPGYNNVSTNYTGARGISLLIQDESDRQGSYVEVVFLDGIMFTDTVEVNFSVTVDPFSRRKVEFNDELKSTIKVSAVGYVSPFGTDKDYPTTGENPIQMGRYESVTINSQSMDCHTEISYKNPYMQIQSSFKMNESSLSETANVISTQSGTHWYSPIRSGPHWVDSYWIQIDFLTVMRLTKFSLLQPDLYRVVTRARFDHSNSGSSFVRGSEFDLSSGGKITFTPPLRARFLRVVIVETNDVTESTQPIAINGLKVFGCVSDTPISDIVQTVLTDTDVTTGTATTKPQRRKVSEYTVEDRTVSSTDLTTYRHYSVDVEEDLVYMCDRQPYRPSQGLACWVSMNAGALWIQQPKYIGSILGYSPKTGRTYFKDNDGNAYLSSLDGVRMDVVNPANMPSILNDADHPFVPSINIPGYNIEKIDTTLSANLTYPNSDYIARYDGIVRLSSGDSLARWSSCCGKPVV